MYKCKFDKVIYYSKSLFIKQNPCIFVKSYGKRVFFIRTLIFIRYMKDRIAQIMKRENMTQQDFAAALDISPSTLSSIFNDRTQPSLTIVYKIHDRFPAINMMWLLYGQGDMYNSGDNNKKDTDISGVSGDRQAEVPQNGNASGNGSASSPGLFDMPPQKPSTPLTERVIEKVKYIDKPPRRITEINVYFDDGTYEVFVPRRKE